MQPNEYHLPSIQYLRAIAALMVVTHHAMNPQAWLFIPFPSYSAFAWGVDIFFVVSGFIMFLAARNENPTDFIARRLIRVVPFYWLATFFHLILNMKFQVWNVDPTTILHVMKSLFFVPHLNLAFPGNVWPYLIPGWTLNYEMLFYAVFFCGLLCNRPLLFVTIVIFGLVILGLIYQPEQVILETYTRPILLEFAFGSWVAWMYTKGYFGKMIPAVAISGFLVLFTTPFINEQDLVVLGRLLGSVLVVSGALCLGTSIPNFRLFRLLGDASYSIYLTHTIISMRLASKFWALVPIEGWLQFLGWIFCILVISSAVGTIVHLYVEKPILGFLRNKWEESFAVTRTSKINDNLS